MAVMVPLVSALKRNPKLGRPPEPTIKRRRHNRARPDGLLGCGVSGAGKTTAKPTVLPQHISGTLFWKILPLASP